MIAYAETLGYLDRLRDVVEESWTPTHCLLLCMDDVHAQDGVSAVDAAPISDHMIKALGFKSLFFGIAHPGKMFAWNDAPGRTKLDVLDLIDTALAK